MSPTIAKYANVDDALIQFHRDQPARVRQYALRCRANEGNSLLPHDLYT